MSEEVANAVKNKVSGAKATEETSNKKLWEIIWNTKGTNTAYVNTLRENSELQFTVDTGDENNPLRLRVLTAEEENILHYFVQDYISNKLPPIAISNEKRREIEQAAYSKVRLMMSLAPKPKGSLTLKKYNDNSQLSLSDLGSLTYSELAYLMKEYQWVDNHYNPSINTLEKSDIAEIIEAVKKQDLELKDFSYSTLFNITTVLIEQYRQEEEILSSLSSS